MEFLRQVTFVHAVQEGTLDVHRRNDDIGIDFVAVIQGDAVALPFLTMILSTPASVRVSPPKACNDPAIAFATAPMPPRAKPQAPDVAVDIAHVVVQQHIRCARRMNAQRGTNDAAAGQRRLDNVGLEILVEILGNAHRPEANRVVHAFLAHFMNLRPCGPAL